MCLDIEDGAGGLGGLRQKPHIHDLIGHFLLDDHLVFRVNRDLNIVADANLRMRRHGAAIGVGQRYLALAALLQFRQQLAVTAALLAQRLDLFSEILDARTVRSGFRDIAFVKALQILLQTLIRRLDELLQRIARKILVLVIDRLDARAIHRQQLAPEKLEVLAQQGELAKHRFEGGAIFTPEIGDGFEVGL